MSAGWTVIDEAAGVLVHTYRFSGGEGAANTFAARMADGRMMVVSPAKGLTDELAAELLRYGPVGALVAPNGWHHLGQAAWRRRFPEARCFAPPEAIARIGKKNKDVGAFEPLSALAAVAGDRIGIRVVPDTKAGESWYWVRTDSGYVWFLSDVLANIPKLPGGMFGLLFRLTRSAPGFRVFHLALMAIVKDKKATLRLLRDDLAAHPPAILVPGHGGVLRQAGLAEETRRLVEAAIR